MESDLAKLSRLLIDLNTQLNAQAWVGWAGDGFALYRPTTGLTVLIDRLSLVLREFGVTIEIQEIADQLENLVRKPEAVREER